MDEDGRDSDADGSAASSVSEEGLGTKQIIKEVVEKMEPVVGRISKLLQQYRGLRVSSTNSLSLWFLHFLEVELSGLSELLRELLLSDLGPGYLDPDVLFCWLSKLNDLVMHIGFELDNHEQAGATARCFCPSTSTTRIPFSDLFQLKKYLRKVPSRTESPCRYKHLLLADDGDCTSSTTSAMRPHLEMDASNMPLVGIESALGNKVLRWFMDSKEHRTHKTISMFGPAGVGKTAIAMELCRRLQNKEREEGNLLCCATAKVSRRPDMKNLLLHILSQISIDEQAAVEQASIDEQAAVEQASIDEQAAVEQASIDEWAALEQASIDELERLVQKISQCLQHRRYLIVIDDLWEISYWEFMKNAFPQNSGGSWIVITTRIRSIADQCCSNSNGLVHEVKSLGEEDSKMLLFRNAFGCKVDYPPENFRHVCAEILRRCEGIPLFIIGMANWLQEQQQEELQHASNYSMEEAPQLLKVFAPALSPTYDDLSYEMKVLVLYLSMLPEGYMFEMDTLQCRWEWEDLIGDRGLSYMDGINEMFTELIDRNIITKVANWKGTLQMEEDCHYKVNYFMLRFLASKSADKGFVCTSGSLTSVATSKHNDKLRRISLHRPDPDLENFLKTSDFSHTRSLAISSTVDGVPLEKFTHLIVLDLEGWQCFKDEDLPLICNSGMFLLKHFSLRKTSVSRLPPEIKKLLMLHTLVASHTQISELPSEVCELGELETLDLRSTQIRQLPEHIWMAPNLETLLVGGDGVNCDPTITEVSKGSRIRFGLRTLETVDLSECSARVVQSLSCLEHLRVLGIRWSFQQCTDARLQEALCSCIKGLTNLMSLTIHCGLGCLMEFLASLPNPLPHGWLMEFKVTGGRFVSIPQWFQGLQRLRSVEITVCRLEQGDLRILASLPSLKCLVLGLHFLPQEEIEIDGGGFNKLERLSVCCRVPWLTFSEGAMPSLTYVELKIGGGPGSEERIPSGIGNLVSLQQLALHYNAWYINDSNVATIVDAVTKAVAKHHNFINLVINGNQYEEEYVQEAGSGVSVTNGIPDHNENLQKAGEDVGRASGSQSEIEIVDAPKLYDLVNIIHILANEVYSVLATLLSRSVSSRFSYTIHTCTCRAPLHMILAGILKTVIDGKLQICRGCCTLLHHPATLQLFPSKFIRVKIIMFPT